MADDSSDLSSLSSLSPAPSGDESEIELKPQDGILKFFHRVSKDEVTEARKKEMSPPPRKREPSPPHDYIFADNPDIAFIVMFRKRFDPVMPRSLAHFGPVELEQDLVQDPPAERVEHFLCVILGLLLNRKQDIKIGHYHKALNDDAINGALFKPQWPRSWNGQSPLAGGATFHTLTPDQRVNLLKTLILWALGHSDAVKAFVTTGYNQHKRTTEDLNQPLSVQPWGTDSDKRRYYLIEGDDNTSFRIYREGNPAALYNRQWITVAGSIDEAKALAEKLARADGGQNARKLSKSIANNIVNFEEKEEKRKRREYRRQQKERFRRPEPGFSLYEGRTRGKRVKYTYSDDEDFMTDSTGNRRSTRNTRNHSPVDTGPVVTASGRQSRPPARLAVDNLSNGGASAAPSELGDAALDGIVDIEMSEAPEVGPGGRPRRSAAVHHGTNGWTNPRKRRKDYISDDEDEDESEPDFGDDEEEEHVPQDESDDEEEFENAAVEDDDDDVAGDSPKSNDSRVVKFNIKVKFDKDGKAKKLQKGGDSSSAPTPSNVASSPEAADSPSDDSPNDVANHEPERTADEITAAPLKRGEPTLVSAAGPPRASSAAPAADDTKSQPPASAYVVATNGDAKPEAPSGVPAAEERKVDLAPRAPPTPGGGVPASLAFRSPEKPRAAVASTNRD